MNWALPWPWMVRYWKPLTFLCGLSWLVWGALFLEYPDWDIPLSLLMAVSTYVSADKFTHAYLEGNWKQLLTWTPAAWWAVDGSYWLYWSLVDTSVMIRAGQWPMSLCLYLLAGLVWTAFRPGMPPTGLRPRRYIPE